VTGITSIDPREIEQRKERVRRAWRYQRVDHIPIGIALDDPGPYTLRQVCEDGQLQFERNRHNIDRLLRLLPDDYLPAARVWPGYMTIASVFGVPIHWSDDPNQAPGALEHPIRDLAQLADLARPDAATSGLMPFNLRWLRYFAEQFPPEISLTGIDLGGPINTAKDLFDTDLLYTAFYDDPAAMHRFLDLAARVQIDCLAATIDAVGDINRLSSIDFDPIWAPEGRKGFISDDVCASFGPEIFRAFSRPHNNAILRRWPGGRIHNCGPHPAIDLYLDHDPPINGLNCSFRCTRPELGRIKEAFRGRGIVEFMFDFGETVEQIIRGYEEIARALAPDVVGIPVLWFDARWTDDAIREVYHGLRGVAERYAREMHWVGEG